MGKSSSNCNYSSNSTKRRSFVNWKKYGENLFSVRKNTERSWNVSKPCAKPKKKMPSGKGDRNKDLWNSLKNAKSASKSSNSYERRLSLHHEKTT